MMLLLSRPLCLCWTVLLISITHAVSFACNDGVVVVSRKRNNKSHFPPSLRHGLHRMNSNNNNALFQDTLVPTGDAASLGFFSIVQSLVDPYEPSLAALLLGGDDATTAADYRLDLLADPFVASAVVVPCWLLAGLVSDSYVAGAALRTTEESLENVVRMYVPYLPFVTIVLAGLGIAMRGGGDGGTWIIAAPDFTFCAGAISIVGSWRFTLANTIGR